MKKVRYFILFSLLAAAILFSVLPTNYPGGISNKWPAVGFELVKLLLQLVIAGIIGKILVDTYNEGREKEKAANKFRIDLLDALVKAYYKAKKVRRILRGNLIPENGAKKINRKVYDEQMRDIIDAQLALEYHKFQLDSFSVNFKNIHLLKTKAKKLEGYLSDLISEYEKLGGIGEFISLADLNGLRDFFETEKFKAGFSKYFHSSVELIGEEIFEFDKKQIKPIRK